MRQRNRSALTSGLVTLTLFVMVFVGLAIAEAAPAAARVGSAATSATPAANAAVPYTNSAYSDSAY